MDTVLTKKIAYDVIARIGQGRPIRITPYYFILGFVGYKFSHEEVADLSEIIDKHCEQCALGVLAISTARVLKDISYFQNLLNPAPFNMGYHVDGVSRQDVVRYLSYAFTMTQLALIETAFTGTDMCDFYTKRAGLSLEDTYPALKHARRYKEPSKRMSDIAYNIDHNDGFFTPGRPVEISDPRD